MTRRPSRPDTLDDGARNRRGQALVFIEDKPQGIGHQFDGCTSQLWPAGRTVASEILDPTSKLAGLVKGKGVLELGSGCGIVGLACAAAGAASVRLTDQSNVMEHLQRNVQRNTEATHGCDVGAEELAWGVVEEGRYDVAHRDVVVLTDCTYWASLYDKLMITILSVCHGGTTLVLAHLERRPAVERDFFKALQGFFEVKERWTAAEPRSFDWDVEQAPGDEGGGVGGGAAAGKEDHPHEIQILVLHLRKDLGQGAVQRAISHFQRVQADREYLMRQIDILAEDIDSIQGE